LELLQEFRKTSKVELSTIRGTEFLIDSFDFWPAFQIPYELLVFWVVKVSFIFGVCFLLEGQRRLM